MKRASRNRVVQSKQVTIDNTLTTSESSKLDTNNISSPVQIATGNISKSDSENYLNTQNIKEELDTQKKEAMSSESKVNSNLLVSKTTPVINELILNYEKKIRLLSNSNNNLKKLNTKLNKELHEQSKINEIKKENALLLLQLHRVQNELEKYYFQNQKLKEQPLISTNSNIKNKTPKSAVERIKHEAPYKLGALMIENSHSVRNVIKLPIILYKNYILLENLSENSELPPLEQYPDASEIEKVKKHLSYRLGSVFIAHISSPLAMIKLPIALSREVILFRRKDK